MAAAGGNDDCGAKPGAKATAYFFGLAALFHDIGKASIPSDLLYIEELWILAGTSFDTILLEVFISTVGISPPGSLVQPDSDERAIVTRNPDDDGRLFRPVVKTPAIRGGAHIPETIDLSIVREMKIYGYFQNSSAEEIVASLLLSWLSAVSCQHSEESQGRTPCDSARLTADS